MMQQLVFRLASRCEFTIITMPCDVNPLFHSSCACARVLYMCRYGDLRQVLLSCRKRRFRVKLLELVHLMQGVALGMQHIASKGYVQRRVVVSLC